MPNAASRSAPVTAICNYKIISYYVITMCLFLTIVDANFSRGKNNWKGCICSQQFYIFLTDIPRLSTVYLDYQL